MGKKIDLSQVNQLQKDRANLPSFGLTPEMRAQVQKRAAPIQPPANTGGMPLAPGSVYKLSDTEKSVLEPLGWKEGDPIPDNFAELFDSIQEEVKSSQQSLLAEQLPEGVTATTRLKMPRTIPIEDLPPEKQRELREALQTAKEIATQEAEINKTLVPGAHQSINEAIRMANAPQLPIIDDRQQTTYAGTDVPKEPAATPLATTGDTPHYCPQCGWDQAVSDVIEVTEPDKNLFAASIISDTPFVKDYVLLGGQLVITVRSLTQEELDACFYQSAIEYRDQRGTVKTDSDRWEQATRYQVCLQLQKWVGTTTQEFPTRLADWEGEPAKGETLLPQISAFMLEQVFRSASAYRMALNKVMSFNRLLARLEALAQQPDFSIPTSSAA